MATFANDCGQNKHRYNFQQSY